MQKPHKFPKIRHDFTTARRICQGYTRIFVYIDKKKQEICATCTVISRQNRRQERKMVCVSKKGDNIYKRKDGRWEGRYVKNRVNGKVNYGYVYAKSYREAKVKLQSALASQNTNVPAVTKDYPTNPVQFHEISTNWLNAMKSEVKESTFIKYQNLVETYIIPYIGGMELCKMTNDSIESHCKVLLETGGSQKAGLSPKTVTSVVSVIRTILRYAVYGNLKVGQCAHRKVGHF